MDKKLPLFIILGILVTVQIPVFAQNSQKTMNLDEALGALGAELRWDPFFASGTIVSGNHEAAFSSGDIGESGMVLLNHRDVLNLPLPYLDRGDLRFPETFINQIKSTFQRYNDEYSTQFRIAAIIIDPGHGGKDPGASWDDFKVNGKPMKSIEKEITLKVGKLLHAALAASFPDKQLILTRDKDVTLTLEERVNQANSLKLADNEAAIYISLHANSSLNRSARGYEVWYLSPSYRREVIDRSKYTDSTEVLPILNSMLEEEITTESILLANYILKRMGEAVGKQSPSRGLKAEEWFVVRNARMPSVLVELGFVSNETDAILMNDETYLQNLSEALYKGIRDFIAFFERSGGFTALQ